jgi:heat shock protein HtpX
MSRPQIEAVLGHEISHVANGDMVTLALLQGVLNTFVIFLARIIGGIVDRALFKNDWGGANLAGTGSMIGALQVLKQSQGAPMPPQLEAFGINAGDTSGFTRLFMSQPPLDERIAALQTQELYDSRK